MVKKGVSSIKAVILSIAIALVSVFFFTYAVQFVYPAPEYGDYCDENIKLEITSEVECIAVEGKWTSHEGMSPDNKSEGYCDRDFTCRGKYEDVKKIYERNVFFINLILGVGIFIIGFFLTIEAVSSGLMGGGVIMLFYGTIRYWGNLSDIWRTVFLGISLAILVWLGYKKLNN